MRRYVDFLDQAVEPLVTIDLQITPGAQFIAPRPGPLVIESSYRPEGLTYLSYLEAGSVDWQTGRGQLEMHPEAGVENFLRVVYAWLCLQDGGLLLHAAGLIRHGEG